jgi:FkbM family methyltransferase
MNNIDLVKSFDDAVCLSHSGKKQKLLKKPIEQLYIKSITSLGYRGMTRAKTFWNERMIVTLPESSSLNIFRNGFIDEGLTRMILEYLKPGMTFIDIGAHFGYFTLLGSIIVGGKGQVHAFEPTPGSIEILMNNTREKNNVTLVSKAVFSDNRELSFKDYGFSNSGLNTVYNARVFEDMLPDFEYIEYPVQAVTIDDYVEMNSLLPDFIKIDAECSEYQILCGMEKTIDKSHPMISIEVGDGYVKDFTSSRQMIESLIEKKYQPYEYKNGKIVKHILKDEPYQSDNILLMPM